MIRTEAPLSVFFIFFAALMALGVGCSSGGASSGAANETIPAAAIDNAHGGVFVEVVRLHGPDNLMLTLTEDGVLQRLDGSHLQIRRSGRADLGQGVARKILVQAATLGPIRDEGSMPVEGDLYLVVVPGHPPISAVDARATPELRSFIERMLEVAAGVSMSPGEQRFIRAERVHADRADKLRRSGKDAISIDQMGTTARAVSSAYRWIQRPVAVDEDTYSFLNSHFGGREGFVADEEGNWFQISLWSP